MIAVFKREFFSFLNSLTAYITIGLFLLVSGLLLWFFPDTSILEYGYAELSNFFNIAPYLFMFLIPAITMRSFAEERKEGTYVLLATKPISDWHIIIAKYLACLLIVLFSLLPTLVYYYSISALAMPQGNVDGGAVAGSYIGLFLLGASFTAMGIFTSSVTSNQIVAFAVSVFLCFLFFIGFDSMSKIYALQSISQLISNLGISAHYQSISRGVLDSRDLAYFISFTTLFCMFIKLALGGRKW